MKILNEIAFKTRLAARLLLDVVFIVVLSAGSMIAIIGLAVVAAVVAAWFAMR